MIYSVHKRLYSSKLWLTLTHTIKFEKFNPRKSISQALRGLKGNSALFASSLVLSFFIWDHSLRLPWGWIDKRLYIKKMKRVRILIIFVRQKIILQRIRYEKVI